MILKPYKPEEITDNWQLSQITITAEDGSTLSGIYPFSMDGLDTMNVTQRSSSVQLYCNNLYSFSIPTTPSAACFVVIQPGKHKKLSIKYTIKPSGSVNGTIGGIFTMTKTISSIEEYAPNSVTIIQHKLDDIIRFEPGTYDMRQWGAMENVALTHYKDENGNTVSHYSLSNYDKTTIVPNQLTTEGWKDLPNANELAWYLLKGDLRTDDGETLWYVDGTGAEVGTRGAWIKKKEHIDGFNGESDPYGLNLCNEHAKWQYFINTDYTQLYQFQQDHEGTLHVIPAEELSKLINVICSGRPADTSEYFFLPALGAFRPDMGLLHNGYVSGLYWSKSPSLYTNGTFGKDNFQRMAYSIAFYPLEKAATIRCWEGRADGRILAPTWFK